MWPGYEADRERAIQDIMTKYNVDRDIADQVLTALAEREDAFLFGSSDPNASKPSGLMQIGSSNEVITGNNTRRMVLMSGANVGKTTIAQALALHAVTSGHVDYFGENGGSRWAPVPGPNRRTYNRHAEARALRGYHKARKRKAKGRK